MNKKYKVDEESNIIILTEEKEIQTKEKYTNNKDEIFSLKNASIALEIKISRLKDNLNKLKEKTIDSQNNLTTLLLIIVCSTIVSLLLEKNLFLIKIFFKSVLIFSVLSTIVLLRKYIKLKKEIKKSQKRIDEEINRKNRVNKRIEILSKNKTLTIPEKLNEYIEIKPIYDFKFTPTDYFIENYQIEKRAKEMTKSKKKTKTRTNSNKKQKYQF